MKLLSEAVGFVGRALRCDGSSCQLAWGVALGVAIGLMPKANSISLCMIGLLFALRVNLTTGLIAAVAATLVSFVVDPVLHYMGAQLLAVPALQDFYAKLAGMRWIPWTDFNNTVVVGALFVGVCQMIPTYFLFKSYFDNHQPSWVVLGNGRRSLAVTTSGRIG